MPTVVFDSSMAAIMATLIDSVGEPGSSTVAPIAETATVPTPT
jgi:hypothetical protein